jgi:ABC-type Na+ efflux pump permease subunit
MVAGEEEAGTLEVLLVTPVSTRKLVMHKAAALAVSIVMLGIAAGMPAPRGPPASAWWNGETPCHGLTALTNMLAT